MYSRTIRCCVAAFVTFSFPIQANATQTVTSPYVKKGETGIEYKGEYKFDDSKSQDDSWQTKVAVWHNPTDYWQVKVGGDFQKLHDDETDFSSMHIENKFQLAPQGAYFLDPGLRLKYFKSMDGTPDEVEAKLLFGKKTTYIDHLVNFSVNREVGEGHDNALNYGFSYGGAYKFTEDFKLGAEWYSDFKDFDNNFRQQGHQVGPVVYGKIGGFNYQAGAIFGASESAPDVLLKTVLDYRF